MPCGSMSATHQEKMVLKGTFVRKLLAIRAWWRATIESTATAERVAWLAPVVWEPAILLIDPVLQQPVTLSDAGDEAERVPREAVESSAGLLRERAPLLQSRPWPAVRWAWASTRSRAVGTM